MEHVAAIRFIPRPRAGRLARIGEWMARHRRAILALQWAIVALYAVLVVLPAFLPHPHPEARLFSSDFGAASFLDPNACAPGAAPPAPLEKPPYVATWRDRLVLAAQYLFWGVWWPFVILSTLLLGRVWCGVLCPEGALTEFASRHGRGLPIPRWLRWGGWPAVAFILTTIYGQLVSVYEYADAALLILGGSTIAAVLVGFLYGKGKRVWCRYLCPVSGVFALLARVAPLHFRVDRARWESWPGRTPAVDCAPLLNVKTLSGASQCHACGRCAGHRDAVTLALRSPNEEILAGRVPATAEAVLLVFGLIGVASGAFQWSVNPWFVLARQAAATWLIERDIAWPLEAGAPWWLLTRHEEANDLFTWLDGGLILAYIATAALLLGGLVWLGIRLAARLAGRDWRALSLALVPVAGMGLFLGLTMMSASHLKAEGVALGWLPGLRAALMVPTLGWSAYLGGRLLLAASGNGRRKAMALAAWCLPLAAMGGAWWLLYFRW